MKKLIPLLLVLMSVGLHSQEPKYWEKIDFQFDSGIKQIDIYQDKGGYYIADSAFIVVTQNNKLYYFQSFLSPGSLINSLDTNIVIEKAKVMRTVDSTFIFLITSNNELMMTKDFGVSWKIFGNEFENSAITDIVYLNQYGYYNYSRICISNSLGEAFLSKDYGMTWQKTINGLQGNKISHLSSNNYNIYCLTENKSIYDLYENLDSWEIQSTISESKKINEIRIFEQSSFVFFNEEYKLKFGQYNDLNQVDIGDNIKITCFTVSLWMYLTSAVLINELPDGYLIIFGTDSHGVYFCNNYSVENKPEQFSEEFYGVTISDIETNRYSNPSLCLVGTMLGDLYYSEFHYEPGIVNSINNKLLNLNIAPQPASTKARLSFTLPMESRVSVKLFNTLGIEPFAIDDDFFSEGENSIPLDVSGLADGMYFVAIQYEGKTVVEKLVVRR